MSVFKRLSNVAKGKLKELGKNLGELDPFGADGSDAPDRPVASRPSPTTKDDAAARRATLIRMRDEGLLTDDELAQKLGVTTEDEPDVPAGSGPAPATGRAKKRTL